MPTKTISELAIWRSEIQQALGNNIPMPDSLVKEIVGHFNQTDAAQVFPRASAHSAHIQIAQLGSGPTHKGLGANLATTTIPATPEQLTVATAQLLTALFTEVTFESDVLTRIAMPIANQTALNLASYLVATVPTTAAPNYQDEEAVFTNPFNTKGTNGSDSRAGYSSVAKGNHVYHASPRMAAAQALVALTRRFQLTQAAANEVMGAAEKAIMGYMSLCQTFGDVANIASAADRGGRGNDNNNSNSNNSTLSNLFNNSASAATSTFMTIAHNVTMLTLVAFTNVHSSWCNLFSAPIATSGATTAVYEPNTLLKVDAFGKNSATWVKTMSTKIIDSANQHVDAIAASLAPAGGNSYSSANASSDTAAQERARAAVSHYVDGFLAIATLVVGLFRVAQNTDYDHGMDLIIEAFRGDRRELNAPDARSPDVIKVFYFRGKVAKRMVTFCPPSARLQLPSWFIPEVYADVLNTLTGADVLPALKHLSDLDVESCRIYNAVLEEVQTLKQQQLQYQQSIASGVMQFGNQQVDAFGRPTAYVGRVGSALTGAPAATAVAAPVVACYPYTAVMSTLCDLVSFVFSHLPGRYLRQDMEAIVDINTLTHDLYSGNNGGAAGATDTPDQWDAFSRNDNNISTFVFRNVLFHLKDLYEVSGRSGIDTYAAAASSALGLNGVSAAIAGVSGTAQQESSGLWDVFALKATAAYTRMLAQLGGLDEVTAIRIFTTIVGEAQADCTELQWVSLLRQARLALTVVPADATNNQQLGGNGFGLNEGTLGYASSSAAALGNDPFRFTDRMPYGPSSGNNNGPSAAPLPELSSAVMAQGSQQARIFAQQAFATATLQLIANVATSAKRSAVTRAIPLEAVLSLLETKMLSPEALGAILSAAAALTNTPDQQRYCWDLLTQKGLLRIANTPAASSNNGPTSAANNGPAAWAPSTIVADSEINSLPGHCLRECRVGTYPITIAFIRLLLKLIAMSSASTASSQTAATNAAITTNSAADFLNYGSAQKQITTPTANANGTTILYSAAFRSLLKFVADDIVCTLHRRSYANDDDLYELAALSGELLHDALLTFGPNVSQLSAATESSAGAAKDAVIGKATASATAYAAFHTLLATARAPNDVLTQVLSLINEAVADIGANQPISNTRMVSLRVAMKLLYAAMHAIKVDRALSDAVYTFNARTYDNTEFVMAIIRLCCSVPHDDAIARRCFAILALISDAVLGTTVRMVLSSGTSDLRTTARYVMAGIIEAATGATVGGANGDDDLLADGSATAAAVATFGLPCYLAGLDRDHLANADVPSTASCLLDLLIRNVHLGVPSLTTWLCGYDIGSATVVNTSVAPFGDAANTMTTIATNGGLISWEGGCLEVIIAKINDVAFCSTPATAPLATKCIQLIYGLMCNPATATEQFHAILSARGNHSFLRAVHSMVSANNGNHADTDSVNYSTHEGISAYDTISTRKHSISLHQLEFAGYAMRIMSLHLHRLSHKDSLEQRSAELSMRAEHEVNGINLRSSYLGGSNGRFTSGALAMGGTSALCTSHDPLIIEVRKMVRLFAKRNGVAALGLVGSDNSDNECGAANHNGATSGSSGAFGRRMLEVLERLPSYPVLSVPGGATDAFVTQTVNNIPQYSIPALAVALAQTNPNASREEIREQLRIFVFANSCLIGYNATANYLRGWCELLEVVCANTGATELSLEKLMALAEETVAALAMTDKLTIAAQQGMIVALSQSLCAIVTKMGEVKAASVKTPEADRIWAEKSCYTMQGLLTAVVRSLIRFRDISAPARLNLYNIIRVLLSLTPLQGEPYLLSEDRECVMEVMIADICSRNSSGSPNMSSDAALSGFLTPDASCELVALQCLRRFLQLPETLATFAVSSRSTVSAGNVDHHSKHAAGATSSSSSANNNTFVGVDSSSPADCFWSPSAKLVSVVKAIAATIDASCCALFGGGNNVLQYAAFTLEFAECAYDILSLIARSFPHVLYNSGAVEVSFAMRCWELINRLLNDQGNVAVITARHLGEAGAINGITSPTAAASSAAAQFSVPPHVLKLFNDVGVRVLAGNLSWVNTLFEERSMRQHSTLVGTCADFVRAHLALLQSVCKGSRYGARNAAVLNQHGAAANDVTPIHTTQLRLVEEVSLLLSTLSGSPIAIECRALIQLLNIPDLLLSLTAAEMLTHPIFVDDEAEQAQQLSISPAAAAAASPYVSVPIGTITYAQIGHVARTVRNLSSFLLNTVHPILLKMKQQEELAAARIPKRSAQLLASQSTLLPRFSQNLDAANANTSVGTASSSGPVGSTATSTNTSALATNNTRLAATPDDVWPLLEAAFMTALGVLLQQLTVAVSTTIEWEIRTQRAGTWHSKPYVDAITSVTLLTHSAVLQGLLMRKDQPHLFAATSTDTAVKALTFHLKHLSVALKASLGRLGEVLQGILAASAAPSAMTSNPRFVGDAAGGVRAAAGLLESTGGSLADAMDRLNGTGASSSSAASQQTIQRSRLTGGAAYDGRDGLNDESFYTTAKPSATPITAYLSHAGTMQLYQQVQKSRSLVMAASRDADQLFAAESFKTTTAHIALP